MIYVTVMQWMEYSYIFPEGTYRKSIIYAGTSLEMAYAAAEEFEFPDPDDRDQYGYIQCWRDGVIAEDVTVREFDQMFPVVS